MMDNKRLYMPRTIEEAIRDIRQWTAYKTRHPEQKDNGGVMFTERLMEDICNRIAILEKRTAK